MKAKIRYTNIELTVSACYDESGWFMGFTDGNGHYYRAADLVFPDDDDFEVSCK